MLTLNIRGATVTIPEAEIERLWLASVRVERLQEISHNDAVAEGMTTGYWRDEEGARRRDLLASNAAQRFAILWDELNFARGYGWDANPWVWRIEFKRIEHAERAG